MQLLYDDNNISINLTKFDFIYLFRIRELDINKNK